MRRVQISEQPGEARRVIAHAQRAARRGRQPSMAYRNEQNPRRALALALADCGYFPDDLPHIRLRPAPMPLRLHKPWLREVRQALHKFRMVLREAGVKFDWPDKLTDRAVEALIPRLHDMAISLGKTIPPLRYDNSEYSGGDVNELALTSTYHTADGLILPYHSPAHAEDVARQGAGWLAQLAAETNPYDLQQVRRLRLALGFQIVWTDLVADV